MLVKPKKKPTTVATKITPPQPKLPRRTPSYTPGAVKPGTAAAAKPTQPLTPATPSYAAVPTTPVVTPPPMPTIQSTADRQSARYDYGNTMGDVNTQLRNLAASYGGAPTVTQYGYENNADSGMNIDVAANQPGSQLEVLARNLALQKQNIDEGANAENTFFSSRRLSNLGSADSQYGGDLAAAKRAYDAAVGTLTTALNTAKGTRNTNLGQADINDILASQQTPPEAQATAPYDPMADPSVDWAAVHAAFDPKPAAAPRGLRADPNIMKRMRKGWGY